jgi:periplasmic protein CpxP/Spy
MISKRQCTLLFALLLAIPFIAFRPVAAQNQDGGEGPNGQMGRGGRRGPMSTDDRLKRMTKDLNLTADQQTKIKPILDTEQQKMQDLRNDNTGDRQSMRGKMRQIQDDTNMQIRDLLDDTQKVTFDKQEQERQQRMQNGRGGRGGPNGGADGPSPPQQQ